MIINDEKKVVTMKIELFDGQITRNFNIKEFVCKANNEVLINEEVIQHIQRLQKFRDWYNRTMKVNSGYRTPAYNKKVGGSPNSQHLKGTAADIALPDDFQSYNKSRQSEFLENIKKKWEDLCQADKVKGGVGWYNTFVHLDSRSGNGKMTFWDNRN